MKTLTAMMILVFALYFSGCVTTQAGGGGVSSSAPAPSAPSGSKSGKMLTKEDYDRIGVKEMGAR
jgi:uncharacterized membrane protein